jgi:UDP-glucose 4-epimerase
LNILVTGGAGFIASHIVDNYIKEGHSVTIIDNLSTGNKKNINKSAKFYDLDIYNDDLTVVFSENNFDLLNHHAAQIDVRKSVSDPAFDAKVNIIGSINLFQQAVKYNVKKIIFASTGGAIYGEQEYFPADEKHQTNPLSPYGIAKLSIEKYLFFYNAVYGLNYIVLRYGNVYGPRQNPHGEAGVVSIFCEKIIQNTQPVINGEGKQTRDYVYVGDVVNANIKALDYKNSEIFNIGTSVENDVNFIFENVNKYFGNKFEGMHGPAKKGEQLRSVIDNSKAKNLLGWKPEITLEEGLKRTCEWFSSNSDNK